ncbi:MAG: hypothetical protein QW489_01925 [Sulfolobales archaeon]
MKAHPIILVDLLALAVVTLVLSAVALAILQPSDEVYLPALSALLISLVLVFVTLVGFRRAIKVEKT